MMILRILVLICLVGGVISDVSGSAGKGQQYHELSDKEILDHLLHKQRYDKRIKPPGDGSLRINMTLTLLSMSSPDESSLHYEVEFLLHQKWFDPRLIHDDGKRFKYLNAIHHHANMWTPDLFFLKHGTFKGGLKPSDLAVHIHNNGSVHYTIRRHLVLNCEGDLHIFPFDSPMCTFSIESVSFSREQMEFFWSGVNTVSLDPETGKQIAGIITLSPILKLHNAYLVHNETLYCEGEEWRGDFSCLKIKLHFTRDKWFYWTTVFIPGLILVTSSFLSFWLEWNAVPARVMLGVTTMLNYFTTSNGFRSNLPVVSNLTAMNLWDTMCEFFIYTSFLEFVVVNYLARWVQDPEVKEQNKENPILQSLSIVTGTLSMAGDPNHRPHSLGQLQNLGPKMDKFKQKIPSTIPGMNAKMAHHQNARNQEMLTEDSTVTVVTTCGKFDSETASSPVPSMRKPSSPKDAEDEMRRGMYTLNGVIKIDAYSRRLFPFAYIAFVFYFFIRYQVIEGALSID